MKSVAATFSIRSRKDAIAGVDPMSGAAPSRRGFCAGGALPRPADARARSTSSTRAPSCAAWPINWKSQSPRRRLRSNVASSIPRCAAVGPTTSNASASTPSSALSLGQRLARSRSTIDRTGSARFNDSSKAPRTCPGSARLLTARASVASTSPNPRRRSRCRRDTDDSSALCPSATCIDCPPE